jgi:excisionase family DNA binding protein
MSSSAEGRLLLSIPEAAKLLSVGRTMLYRLLERNEIPTIQVGRRRLIPTAALEQWVMSRISSNAE